MSALSRRTLLLGAASVPVAAALPAAPVASAIEHIVTSRSRIEAEMLALGWQPVWTIAATISPSAQPAPQLFLASKQNEEAA